MEVWVDTLCLLPQPKEGQQRIKKQKKNNHNWQIIELYGSPTAKGLKKKHSSRLVGGVETSNRVERTQGKVVAGGAGGQGNG